MNEEFCTECDCPLEEDGSCIYCYYDERKNEDLDD